MSNENQVGEEQWSAGEESARTNGRRHEHAYAYPASTETSNIRESVHRMAEDTNLEPCQTGLIQRFDSDSGRQESAYAYPEWENTSAEMNYRQENVLPYIDFISAQTMVEDPYLEPGETQALFSRIYATL